MTVFAVKVGDSVQGALDSFFGFVPNLVAFLVILVVGWLVARAVKAVIAKALDKVGLDKALHSGQLGQYVEKVSPDASPSRLIGTVVFWFIFIFVLSAAVGALKIPAVTAFMNQVLAYLPNVVAAVLILVVAGAVAGAVAGLVAKLMGDTPTGKVVASIAPVLILGIATFMILDQLQIAPDIVRITYTMVMGAVALGLALAFGLGGRDVAGRMLQDAYDKGRERKDDVKADLQKGKDRAQDQAQEAKTKVQDGAAPRGGGGPIPAPGAAPAA